MFDIKKKISKFLLDEEGSISKKAIINLGVISAAASLLSAPVNARIDAHFHLEAEAIPQIDGTYKALEQMCNEVYGTDARCEFPDAQGNNHLPAWDFVNGKNSEPFRFVRIESIQDKCGPGYSVLAVLEDIDLPVVSEHFSDHHNGATDHVSDHVSGTISIDVQQSEASSVAHKNSIDLKKSGDSLIQAEHMHDICEFGISITKGVTGSDHVSEHLSGTNDHYSDHFNGD